MKVLVVTNVLWRNDNGVGNSYSNIFAGMDNVEFANVCCQEGVSQNTVSKKCFQISESGLIANLKNKTVPSGHIEKVITEYNTTISPGNGIFTIIKRSRLQVFFWLRNLIWKAGRWKSNELNDFIDEFCPDLIFAQVQDCMYLNDLIVYIQEYTKKPLILYAWDDVYSMKQFSLSPLFWIDRLMQRKSLRRLVKHSKILYTISKEQKEEYAKLLKKDTDILYKGYDFCDKPSVAEVETPIHILYTGNLYSGRCKTMEKLCRELFEINKNGVKIHLDIYSGTPLSKKQKRALNIKGTSQFWGSISEREVREKQKEADILLHIEPFTLRGKLLCRLSFSTKLVDYFHNRKCIFAVGDKICSSMKYLKRYDAAIVSQSIKEMRENINRIVDNKELIFEYADKAWECGSKNHRISEIQQRIYDDMINVCREETSNECTMDCK